MIAPLRRRHRWLILVLAVLIPLIAAVVWNARPDRPAAAPAAEQAP